MQQQYVIIVAGGSGSRMKSDLPKQFMKVDGIPAIIRVIQRFLDYNPGIRIIIVVHSTYRSYLEELLDNFDKEHSISVTTGGETRFHSVKNGLVLIDDPDAIVGIHDAARPFVSVQTIRNCFEGAAKAGNAIPCVPVNESLRKMDSEGNRAVDRSTYTIIQTPQCFRVSAIKAAFEQEYSPSFTDDATVLESTGKKINLVEGNAENIKITSPHDLIIANALARL